MSIRLLAALVVGLLTSIASANGPEASIKKAAESFFTGGKVDSVRKLGILNLYEVQLGSDLVYTDEKTSYFVVGHIIDPKTGKDLTQERIDKLTEIKFSELPLDIAIKQVKGNGKRVFVTFEDPNCSFCRKLAQEIQGMSDITVYTFLMPILSQDSVDKSKAIWCSADRAKAWNDYMTKGIAPAAGKCDTSALDRSTELGRRFNIRGTPAIVLTDGTKIPGFLTAAKLDEVLAKVANR